MNTNDEIMNTKLKIMTKGKIAQFQYFKIKPKAIDIPITRPWGINLTTSIVYSPEPHTAIYCFWH